MGHPSCSLCCLAYKKPAFSLITPSIAGFFFLGELAGYFSNSASLIAKQSRSLGCLVGPKRYFSSGRCTHSALPIRLHKTSLFQKDEMRCISGDMIRPRDGLLAEHRISVSRNSWSVGPSERGVVCSGARGASSWCLSVGDHVGTSKEIPTNPPVVIDHLLSSTN